MPIILPVLNFWREPKVYADGSVPGWLSVGIPCLFPPINPKAAVPSVMSELPAACTKGSDLFPTIERGGNFTSLKIGQYKMTHSRKITKPSASKGRYGFESATNTIRCLQCSDAGILNVLIHDVYNNDSTELQGCIAPGMRRKPSPGMGILESATAMEQIFKLLGGYVMGTEVRLNVWSNVPGETRTRYNWPRIRT